ncbi:MAG: hypothetical protein IJ721_08360 [Bacteroidales bacterium]|nr:hypothetical protein [Bacteroidales bacterium]
MVRFESEGLFVGLVSYPFFIDGRDLYHHIFSGFFERQHRQGYLEALSPGKALDRNLYRPEGYRMFGKYGIAVLSLIDDYAFCSRIFNSGHIKVENRYAAENKYKSVVLTGSSEKQTDEPYLYRRALDSFLLDELKFPFIGIIRLKVDYRVLLGKGSIVTRAVKRYVEQMRDSAKEDGRPFESMIVDCYDNDELFVVAFSDSLQTLDTFLKTIRGLDCETLQRGFGCKVWEDRDGKKKHVFSACHMSYGYHMDFTFVPECPGFLKWNEKNDTCDGKYFFNVNCLLETKPGHRKYLCNYLAKNEQEFFGTELEFNRTVTGGSIVHIRIPVGKIESLHQVAKSNEEFKSHVRRMILTLNHCRQPEEETACRHYDEKDEDLVDGGTIGRIREKMTSLGVSKIVRERLLALLDLYNDCGRNKLQSYYFKQMQAAVRNLETILDSFIAAEDEPLSDIERNLNEEISAFETAFYNRMHNKMTPNAVLEYGGGIQQFLQAFGFAYQSLVRLCSPAEAEKQYSLITGVSKESSIRTHTELNINHIIYPQLFSTTSWKEASNFSIRILDRHHIVAEKNQFGPAPYRMQEYFNSFQEFIQEDRSFEIIRYLLYQQTDMVGLDPVYRAINSLINRTLIKYALSDYLVYHLAFQRDFGLMWYHYWKAFLQTTSVYGRRGVVTRRNLVFFLLRLSLVAAIEKDTVRRGRIDAFLERQADHPFDNLVADLWLECFQKTRSAGANMVRNLDSYGLSAVSEQLVRSCEYVLIDGEEFPDCYAEYLRRAAEGIRAEDDWMETVDALLAARRENVDHLRKKMGEGSLSFDDFKSGNPSSPDNVLCLLSAFLFTVRSLDEDGKASDVVMRSVPRGPDGSIDFAAVADLKRISGHILSDPIGGFVIPDPDIRRRYFACRTTLYRTLWDLSYRGRK